MNDELTKKLIEWIENLGNLAGDELPGFVQEIATYGFYSSIIGSIAFFIIAGILGSIAYFCLTKNDDSDGKVIGGNVALFFA